MTSRFEPYKTDGHSDFVTYGGERGFVVLRVGDVPDGDGRREVGRPEVRRAPRVGQSDLKEVKELQTRRERSPEGMYSRGA